METIKTYFSLQKLEGLQNELMETRSKFEEERTAKNEEVELLLADLDRANLNAQAAAKEAEELRNSFESQPKVQPYSLKKKFIYIII